MITSKRREWRNGRICQDFDPHPFGPYSPMDQAHGYGLDALAFPIFSSSSGAPPFSCTYSSRRNLSPRMTQKGPWVQSHLKIFSLRSHDKIHRKNDELARPSAGSSRILAERHWRWLPLSPPVHRVHSPRRRHLCSAADSPDSATSPRGVSRYTNPSGAAPVGAGPLSNLRINEGRGHTV